MRGDEDVDLAGDVEVMRPAGEAGVEHRRARRRERTGAVQQDIDVAQRGRRSRRIIDIEASPREIELRPQGFDWRRPSSGQNRAKTLALGFPRDQAAGEAVGAVQDPVGVHSHLRPCARNKGLTVRTRNASASIKAPAVYKTFHDKEDGCVDIVPHGLPVAPPRPDNAAGRFERLDGKLTRKEPKRLRTGDGSRLQDLSPACRRLPTE